ncbi:ABC transporter permease [Alicyclobacillus acidiphilus]|uniref:ABC transporter permease n=1 Tax=Alicyclobacillus acidiphilus TaxID=182455 RepID=UPI00082F88D4|nr:ABC transporter permease [Alicyclobacillus acidiphilus]
MSVVVTRETGYRGLTIPVRVGRSWKRFARGGFSVAGLVWLVILAIAAASRHQVVQIDIFDAFSPPSWTHPFGTNNMGQDMFWMCMDGLRYTLMVACGATTVAALVGTTIGIVSGMRGGWLDQVLMRFCDYIYSFPAFLCAIMLISMFGSNAFNVIWVLGITQWAGYARLARGQVLAIRQSDLTESARSLGASELYVSTRYVLPHVISPLVVYSAFTAANLVMLEAMLDIVGGIGPKPPMFSFGAILFQDVTNILGYPWLLLFPLALFVSMLVSFVVVGDGLQAAFDPRGGTSL